MGAKYQNFSFFEFQQLFPDDDACWKYLLETRWANGYSCPRCGHPGFSYHSTRELLQCKKCRYQVSATAGTIFHKTRTSLRKWFWMIYLMSTSKTGVSIQAIQRLLEIKSYKTAWSMAHKIRKAMADRDAHYQLAGLVEMDESYFGGAGKGTIPGRGSETKVPVVVGIEHKGERAGFAAMKVLTDVEKESIVGFAEAKIEKGADVISDGFPSYLPLRDEGYGLEMRIVGEGKNASKVLPWVHVTIANVKSVIRGAHHGVSQKHLQRYLDEFCYRLNRRFKPREIFHRLLTAALLTPTITYADLTA